MPFTLSHPAAALVLRPIGLPTAAVVAGTMAPDLPLFLPGHAGYGFTHSWPGVVSADLVVGLVWVAVWWLLLRDPLVDSAPARVRQRLPAHRPPALRDWTWAPVAVVVGAASHVVWDSFTHPDRWGSRRVAWLSEQHLGLAGASWAQYASTWLGLLVIAVWATRTILRAPTPPAGARPVTVDALGGRAVPIALVPAALVGGVAAVSKLSDGLHSVAFAGAEMGTLVLGLDLLALAVAWQLLSRRARRSARLRPTSPR